MIPYSFLIGFAIGTLCQKLYDKKDKIVKIHETIQKYNPSFIQSWYETVKTIVKIQSEGLYDNFIKKIKSSKCINHDTHEIEYYFKGKKYKFYFEDISINLNCINVYDQDGHDITGKFLEYLGPSCDFHGKKYTPRDLGVEKLTIFDDELNQKNYNENDIIDLPISFGIIKL